MAEGKNFFERWGRSPAATGQGAAPGVPAVPGVPGVPAPTGAEGSTSPAGNASPVPADAPGALPGHAANRPEPAPQERPPLTLADAERLTPKDNFAPFVARQVPSAVRNAAMKKLFADPHFNVMDGLDIYIDDYSLPSPLSPAMMAKMVSAQVMKLVPDPADALKAAAGGAPASAAPAPALSDAPDAADAPAPEAQAHGEAQATQADGPAAADAGATPPAPPGPASEADAPPAAQTYPVDGAAEASAEATPAAPATEPSPAIPASASR